MAQVKIAIATLSVLHGRRHVDIIHTMATTHDVQ